MRFARSRPSTIRMPSDRMPVCRKGWQAGAAALMLGLGLLGGLPGTALPATAQTMTEQTTTEQAPAQAGITLSHALAEFSTPLYDAGFRHFRYVNPEAPKGGTLAMAEQGSFDSLNPVILRGQSPRTLGLIGDTLMAPSGDELDVLYGLIAETVEFPQDKGWIIFNLRPAARWHDGQPVTADDFVFAWNAIQQHGHPFLKAFLDDVATLEALTPHRLKATFKTTGSMKPLVQLAGTLGPQPRHWWTAEGRDIARTTLEPILASGPYRIAKVEPGRSIAYERVPDYWGKDLPVNTGQNNFDTIRVDYYRDDEVMFEAFKAGAYDVRQENRAQRWTTGYDLPQVRDGRIVKLALPNERPGGAQGIRLNTRRAKFADPRVREALGWLYDFEWLQKTILYGQYKRVKSNFPNSDFGAQGAPTEAELAVLNKYRDRIADQRVLSEPFEPPTTDGTGNIRANLRKAAGLFRAAGWENKGGKLVKTATGEAMTIEFLENSQTMVRVLQPYVETLRRAGIDATIRVVDSAQYQNRTDEFDFDAVTTNFNFFPPPGTELRSYFGSAAAGQKGAANYAGIKDPVVDALIEEVVSARDLPALKTASRALDRAVLWGFYMVPQWYKDEDWFALWDKYGRPDTRPRYDTGFPGTWWYDPDKARKVASR